MERKVTKKSKNKKPKLEAVCEMFDLHKQVFIDKNHDYAFAYILAGKMMEIMSQGKPVVLTTAEDHIAYQLLTRKMDKLLRFFNLRFNTKNQKVVGEKKADTMGDDAVYSLLLKDVELNGIDF